LPDVTVILRMAAGIPRPPLDATGIVLSSLCIIHCLAVPLIATGALVWVASEAIHIGLTIALAGVVVLVAWPGYRLHRRVSVPAMLVGGLVVLVVAILSDDPLGEYAETSLTVFGSAMLTAGHLLNLRCSRIRR